VSLDELAKASCAIYVDDYRDGTGTLVTDSHVLTADHVLRRDGPVTIRFRDGLLGEPIPVARVPLGAAAEQLDIAVLELGPGTGGRPAPAKLWPAKRLPQETRAFGYPKIEGAAPRGVWRDSTVSGAVQGGLVQLDWDEVGTLDGHSGGPVCDRLSGLMVGVLVEGSELAHFDRMVTLPAVRAVWDGLPRPWLFAGEDARANFTQRAAGQPSAARGGNLFRGRREALAVVNGWLCADAGPEIPLVITAQPGAGKSAVLARAALAIERTGQFDGVAFHARSATVADLIDAMSAASGLDTPTSWRELVAELTGQGTHDVLAVAIDALDEAQSDQDLAELRRALRELARLDWLRIAIATRPLATGDVYAQGSHLYGLGVTRGEDSRNLVNLDADRFFATKDLIAYADTLLAQDGFTNQGPPGGAWKFYAENKETRARLARVVASRADRNYLVAGMSAFQLGEGDLPLDPASPLFDASDVPSGVGEALSNHLERLPQERQWPEEILLTALAYGRGAGLDDQRWLAFTRALGYDELKKRTLAELKASAAADYLLETSTEAGDLVTRLFHQALTDELLRRRERRDDEARLVELLQAEGGDRRWLACSPYARNHAPSHAAEAGILTRLVREADFLVCMLPAALRTALAGLPPGGRDDPAAIYEVALPFLGDEPGVNAAVLEFVSGIQGNRALSQELSELRVIRPYKVVGSVRPFDPALARFDGHTKVVWGVATLGWPGLGRPVLATTSWDGTARVWDPRDPGRELARFEGHTGEVWGVAALDWPGLDHPVLATTSADGTARVWDPAEPGRELARFDGHIGAVVGVAALAWPGLDHPVLATTSDDQTARVWDPCDPGRELARFDGHTAAVAGVAALAWPGLDHPVLATTSDDGTARVWDPSDPGRELARFDGHTGGVMGVAELDWPGLDHPVLATTSHDGTARVWDPRDPGLQLARFDGHSGIVVGVAELAWPGLDHPVLATTSVDLTARIWDPCDSGLQLARFDGHSGIVRRVAALGWPGLDHAVLATTSSDGTARVWDTRDPGRELARFDGHTAGVMGVAALDWPGLDHPVLATTSVDRTARVWDPRDPGRELARFDGHTRAVLGVAALAWPGLDHPVLATTSWDGTARVWDPRDPGRELARFEGHTDLVWSVAALPWPGLDHPVLATTSSDRTARVWDPRDPGRELARFDLHTDVVVGVAALDWPGLDHPVLVTTSDDGTARVWDPRDPGRELARFEGHTDVVWGVAALDWPGLDHPVLATASRDGTARVWDCLQPDRELAYLPLFGQGNSVVVLHPMTLGVASSRGFVVFELGQLPTP
jgi:WD40 repeat protein